jgi:hypothetical protein
MITNTGLAPFDQNWIPLLLNLLALIGIGVHGIVYANILPEKVVYHYDAYVCAIETFGDRNGTKTVPIVPVLNLTVF